MNNTVLLVIPTLNEAAHIETCLHDLIDGDAAAGEAAIVVMDGGSSDDTCAIVRRFASTHPNVRLEHNPRRLQSAAVNRAARLAGSERDILVRCDAHARYPANYVTALLEALARSEADSVVVPMDAVGETCFQKAVAWIVDTPFGSGGAPHRGGVKSGFVDHGHHAAFRLERFLALGGYDETFSHNEDAEYDRRLTQAGGRIWLDADIRVRYFPRAAPKSLWRQYFNYGRGRASMLTKHKLTPAPRQLIPVINLLALGFSALLGLAGSPLAMIGPLLYASVLVGASLCVALKHRSLCAFAAGPALAIMHNAWALGFLTARLRLLFGPAPETVSSF